MPAAPPSDPGQGCASLVQPVPLPDGLDRTGFRAPVADDDPRAGQGQHDHKGEPGEQRGRSNHVALDVGQEQCVENGGDVGFRGAAVNQPDLLGQDLLRASLRLLGRRTGCLRPGRAEDRQEPGENGHRPLARTWVTGSRAGPAPASRRTKLNTGGVIRGISTVFDAPDRDRVGADARSQPCRGNCVSRGGRGECRPGRACSPRRQPQARLCGPRSPRTARLPGPPCRAHPG